ncbi:MAG: lytic transglycosylase domain-containing protein [Burkholderiaceae bacterium]|nr:lytic transglycosylase domain-containing protein [Burkholderiaceae bacterium]MCP5290569.1 lytic transglycosylase domain-containing protein [Burkholderiaceae bacterium]HMQ71571.1 lytic transglycosylase domain-containing protein [Rubrivivax sp.]
MKTADAIRRARRTLEAGLSRLTGAPAEPGPTRARRALDVGRNALALLGLAVIAAALVFVAHPERREQAEADALQWLQTRELARLDAHAEPPAVALSPDPEPEPDAVARATAADPSELGAEQARVATWISRRYRVAPEPVARLVQEAWAVGQAARLEPTLILAVMAVESSFNPFAQSSVGAQGLMQVMTRVHDSKYEPFGGVHAAFDPVTNLRVGVQVLKDCVRRFGGVQGGLRCYVGAALLEHDGGYAAKVMHEQQYLARVARGERVSPHVRRTPPPAPRPAVPLPEAAPRLDEAAVDPTPAPDSTAAVTATVALADAE